MNLKYVIGKESSYCLLTNQSKDSANMKMTMIYIFFVTAITPFLKKKMVLPKQTIQLFYAGLDG